MTDSSDNKRPEDWLTDLSNDSRVEGYRPGEMILCAKCVRSNPPNRLDCMYCGLVLELSEEQSGKLRPLLRKAEPWKNATNIIAVKSPANQSDEGLRKAAKMLRIEFIDLKTMLAEGIPLPIARSEQETEIGIVVKRLNELGLETSVLLDSEFELSIPARRLRKIGFGEGSLDITLFSDGTVKKIDRTEISQIVVGILFEHRVETTEKHIRKKDENKILETAEMSGDELVIDIYTREDPIGFRISPTGFDFSFLNEEKSMIVSENMKTVIAKLKSFAPEARFDESYAKVRAFLSQIWDVAEHTDSKGLKRRGFGGYNRELVTTSSNNEQFTKYSRLQWHLK